jgi:hypothetical protein
MGPNAPICDMGVMTQNLAKMNLKAHTEIMLISLCKTKVGLRSKQKQDRLIAQTKIGLNKDKTRD